jgi:glycosyltransferase
MKVSIITASFKCANTIEDCIKSIINQTYSNIEHIIIDGGSKDV